MSDQENGSDAAMQAPPKKRIRWGRWVLVASLAFNVLIVGFVASRAYQFAGKHWRDGSAVVQVAKQGRKFVKDLPRERRRELFKMIKSRRGEFKLDDAEVKSAVTALAEAIRQSPYDPARTEEALMMVQQQAETLLSRGRAVTMDVIAELSEEERSKLAERLIKGANEKR